MYADRHTQAVLSRVHSTPSAEGKSFYQRSHDFVDSVPVPAIVQLAEASVGNAVQIIGQLNELASKYPFYKYQWAWTRQMQDVVGTVPSLASLIC